MTDTTDICTPCGQPPADGRLWTTAPRVDCCRACAAEITGIDPAPEEDQ